MLNSLKTGGAFVIKPSETHSGRFLGSLLASMAEVHLKQVHLEALECHKEKFWEVQQNQNQAQAIALKIKVGLEHQD